MNFEDRKSDLLDVALRVFAERGVEATSMKALAAEAGVSSALFYHYFRSKEEILSLALGGKGLSAHIADILEGVRERPASEVLPQIAEALDRMMEERRHLVWLFLQESKTRECVRQRMDEERERSLGLVEDYLQGRVRAGELRPHDSRAVGNILLSTLFMHKLRPYQAGSLVPALTDVLLHGLESAPGTRDGAPPSRRAVAGDRPR